MEIDTGSSVSIIAWHTISRLVPSLRKHQLDRARLKLRDYQGNHIPILGSGYFQVQYKNFNDRLRIIVVDGILPSLLGLEWFDALGLAITGIHALASDHFSDLFQEFSDVFSKELGKYKGSPISLNLDPSIAPIRLKPLRVPFALRTKVDQEIDKLLAQGILQPVDHARWETPIVIPIMADGSIRICADYKATLNKALQANPYPVPVVQHLLHSLGRGSIFAKLDMAQAYQQLEVDDESAEAQTIVTHRGAFKCRRLQFGVCVAPGIFQCLMERLLHGLPGVVPYFDDIFVSATDEAELLHRLTDHKPLLGILAGDRQTPLILSPRMTRWVGFLAAYQYTLVYRPGKAIGHADALSRCPLPIPAEDPAPASSVLFINDQAIPVSASDVAKFSSKDRTLRQVADWVRRGWPLGQLASEFQPYKVRQHEISIIRGCLLWGSRVIIPDELRGRILNVLHEGHPGITRMKALAHSYLWWPRLDGEIAEWVAGCPRCQIHRAAPPAAVATEWEMPKSPWARVHIDFAGPIQGHMLLIIVDAYSKWVEVVSMTSITSEALIHALKRVFATHGLPDVLVSDNGPQLTSAAFQAYLAKQGIRHATIAPFRPASNGLAERTVRSAKEVLAKLRRLRTVLDRLHPEYSPEKPPNSTSGARAFQVGDWVYAQHFGGDPRWLPGQIEEVTGPRSYRVQLEDGRMWRRHVDQLCRRHMPPSNVPSNTDLAASNQPPPVQSKESRPEIMPNPDSPPTTSPAVDLPQRPHQDQSNEFPSSAAEQAPEVREVPVRVPSTAPGTVVLRSFEIHQRQILIFENASSTLVGFGKIQNAQCDFARR
ncbi:uncharacterized protein K02A2.6-like [Ahaetulla prasina]|uniref:uncharacterized protein K02A2.6-like n=1 Tax=Ahaetulla prasina TaxID=499056 RepID=UPI00264835F5|nr:uncharacterized protein K02A2.6-like [Ahaetulla prasina]